MTAQQEARLLLGCNLCWSLHEEPALQKEVHKITKAYSQKVLQLALEGATDA